MDNNKPKPNLLRRLGRRIIERRKAYLGTSERNPPAGTPARHARTGHGSLSRCAGIGCRLCDPYQAAFHQLWVLLGPHLSTTAPVHGIVERPDQGSQERRMAQMNDRQLQRNTMTSCDLASPSIRRKRCLGTICRQCGNVCFQQRGLAVAELFQQLPLLIRANAGLP